MSKALVVNGSPSLDKGNTAHVLSFFIDGLREGGCEPEVVYPSGMDLEPCSCAIMHCWYTKPGECCIDDGMSAVYPKLREADTLVLATPVYTPLPGRMQDFMNRMTPMMRPRLRSKDGRTRATFRKEVGIRRIALLAVSGWWEKANMDTLVRITREYADDCGVKFAGAVLRPHAFLMSSYRPVADEAKHIRELLKKAGTELAVLGRMKEDTLDAISVPLISEQKLRERFNRLCPDER